MNPFRNKHNKKYKTYVAEFVTKPDLELKQEPILEPFLIKDPPPFDIKEYIDLEALGERAIEIIETEPDKETPELTIEHIKDLIAREVADKINIFLQNHGHLVFGEPQENIQTKEINMQTNEINNDCICECESENSSCNSCNTSSKCSSSSSSSSSDDECDCNECKEKLQYKMATRRYLRKN